MWTDRFHDLELVVVSVDAVEVAVLEAEPLASQLEQTVEFLAERRLRVGDYLV